MKIKFWGVRGSIPCPGRNTVQYGGNTPCIELRFPDLDRYIIIDAGSGIRELGNYLMANDLPKGPIDTEIFLTHTHWDHIMGFPFFVPTYVPGTSLKIHGPVTHEEDTLDKVVGGQLSYRYFPVRDVELAARIKYHQLKEGILDLGDGISLTSKYLNHPILCLGYKFEYQGKIFCTAYDTEPFTNIFCTDKNDPSYDEIMAEEGEREARLQNQMIENFFSGVDVLIHDTQYTSEEYESSKRGWGHTPYDYAIAAANRANVKKIVMFHYDPMSTDEQLDRLADEYSNRDKYGPTEVIFSREGMEIEI